MTERYHKRQVLNFYPYYEELLRHGTKNTTIRLEEDANVIEGQVVSVTTGWSEQSARELFKARITSAVTKGIEDLTECDLQGESPDCKSPEAVRYVISCIYRRVVSPTDKVRLIKFQKIDD